MPSADQLLIGYYDYRLVILSVLIAVLGSYNTIELGGRITAARGRNRLPWLAGGALAMGIGTWSMHYTGMLGFRLPVQVQYDLPTAFLSLLASVFSSTVALFVISRRRMGWIRALAGSVFMGGGIVALHYIAMASMRLPAMCVYSPPLVTLSVVIAIGFSLMSLWMAFLFRNPIGQRLRKISSSIMLGAAICAMHYTAMASASFINTGVIPDVSHAVNISYLGAAGIGVVGIMVLAVALLTSLADKLQQRTALLNELFEQAPQAVALTNAGGRVLRVNREFTSVFGFNPEEAVGRRLTELIVPEELREQSERYADQVMRGQRLEAESIRRRKDGSGVSVSMIHVPVSLPEEIAVYAIYHDITDRKRAEEHLKATTEQLRALSASLSSAREEEGTRIARELHDELGSSLTSLKWELESIDKLCSESENAADSSRLRQKTNHMMEVIDSTIDSVRRISSELHPTILDDLGLLEAIEWQAQQFEARTGIVTKIDSFVEDIDLSREQATAIFRILQEALTNIIRHAKATIVNITIEKTGDEFVLEIRDNGKGITQTEQSGLRSFGLMSMRERAQLAGGSLDIVGVTEKGTALTLRVPIQGHAKLDRPPE